jgi:hypothetical protein
VEPARRAARSKALSAASVRRHRYIALVLVFTFTMSGQARNGAPPARRRRATAAMAAAALVALGLPAIAAATLTEVGQRARTTSPTAPSCPGNPCLAVTRTTGFQMRVGSLTAPVTIPRSGRIVAWTITLSKPNTAQVQYFNTHEGGAPSAGIAILRPNPQPKSKPKSKGRKSGRGAAASASAAAAKHHAPAPALRGYTLVAQAPVVPLEKYLGETVQLPLEKTLEVQKGDVVALTVPTWAPALTLGFGKETAWRASRPTAKKGCEETGVATQQTKIGSSNLYACVYHEARLTYSATLISTP